MIDAMRDAVGRTFLAAEPRLRQFYRSQYAQPERSTGAHGDDEGERARALGGDASFRCSECYHLFGVDLIADAQQRMHVIEVNVAPDLSLSTQGPCHQSNCTDGSTAYDHTKLAAAYNTVRLVYARQAAATQLERLIEHHAVDISNLDLLISPPSPPTHTPLASRKAGDGSPVSSSIPVLHQDVAEYLLDVIRERRAAGCFAPVYPSARHHAAHGEQLEMMSHSNLRACPEPRNSSDDSQRQTAPPLCNSIRRRLQMHALLGIVMQNLTEPDETQIGSSSFRRRCERMLREVPSDGDKGAWGRRTHVFRRVWDLVS